MRLKPLIVASSLLWASSALAEERSKAVGPAPLPPTDTAPAASPPSLEAPDRPQPMFAVRGSLFSGFPDIAGVSVSLLAFRGLEFEIGASHVMFAYSVYLRGGPRFELIPRIKEAGFELALPVMIGVRALFGFEANLVVGLEATRWVSRHLGLTAQLIAGGIYSRTFTADLRLSAGFAF